MADGVFVGTKMSNIPRNTIFALLMATEQDLRALIANHLSDSNPLTQDEIAEAKSRRSAGSSLPVPAASWIDLLDYLDLSQTLAILSRHEVYLCRVLSATKEVFQKLLRRLRDLNPIRNRVCHARPLEPDDFLITHEIVREIISTSFVSFVRLQDVRHELETNLSYPLTVSIPEFWRADVATIENNLPPPDFDDTGFIGRESDRQNLLSLLQGNKDIITVTGEGGVGKTSLTLRCLYDLVERTGDYDLVYWASLKTNTLTPAGIRKIAGAMTSEFTVLSSFADRFGTSESQSSPAELFLSVRDILRNFRVLLAIDNTETIARESLRPLFLDIPRDSKIVLTSRIGIGEFETRYPLAPMTSKDSIDLMRRTARLFNVEGLVRKPNPEIEAVCKRLFNNPLAVRWFVQSYSEGRSTATLLDRRRDLSEVLNFCFQNLYTALDDRKRQYLRILVSVGKPLSEVQLALLSENNDVEGVRSDLRYLFGSNLLRRSSDNWNDSDSLLWAPSDFAREFILSHDKPLAGDRTRYETKYRELLRARDLARDDAATNRFRTRTILATSTDEATVVILLQQTRSFIAMGNYDKALETVRRACGLLPEFHEVWRISAQAKAASGDILGATDDFDKALELADGRSEPLLVHYAWFLLKQEQGQQALHILEEAAAKPKAAPQLVATFAWLKVRFGDVFQAVTLFESVLDKIRELGGDERTLFLTQFADSLRRAADTKQSRQEHADALTYILRSLQVLSDACEGRTPDKGLINTAQKCVSRALNVVAERCDLSEWQALESHLRPLSVRLPISMTDQRGVGMLQRECPLIASRTDFKRLGFGLRRGAGEEQLSSNIVLIGVLVRPDPAKGFGFIRGNDGQEYFFHATNYNGVETWQELCQMGSPYLQFVAAPEQEGKRSRALDVYLVDPELDFHESM